MLPPKPHERTITIDASLCLSGGLLDHPRYFDLFNDNTKWMLSHILQLPDTEVERTFELVNLPVKRLQCDVTLQSRVADRVLLSSQITRLTETELDIVHRIIGMDGRCRANCCETRVSVTAHDGIIKGKLLLSALRCIAAPKLTHIHVVQ